LRSLLIRLLFTFALLTLFVLGVDWVLEASGLTTLIRHDAVWPGLRQLKQPHLSMGIGVAAMLLPVFAAAAWLLWGADSSISANSTEGDTIRLAPDAIERTLRREIKANVLDVIDASAYARQGKNGAPAITVNAVVSDREPTPKLEHAIRAETVRVLRHLLGVADTSQVKVVITDVRGPKVAAKKPRPEKGDRPRRPRPEGQQAKPKRPALPGTAKASAPSGSE